MRFACISKVVPVLGKDSDQTIEASQGSEVNALSHCQAFTFANYTFFVKNVKYVGHQQNKALGAFRRIPHSRAGEISLPLQVCTWGMVSSIPKAGLLSVKAIGSNVAVGSRFGGVWAEHWSPRISLCAMTGTMDGSP